MATVQYGFAIGMTAGLTRRPLAHPGYIALEGIFRVWASAEESSVATCDDTVGWLRLSVAYLTGAGYGNTGETGNLLSQQAGGVNCGINRLLEIRGLMGSEDTETHTKAADGYLELRLNSDVLFRVDNIALGINGLEGWGSRTVAIAPSTQADAIGPDGMTALYINDVDVYGPRVDSHGLYNQAFSTATEAELWSNLGGLWTRWATTSGTVGQIGVGYSGPIFGQPALIGGLVTANNAFMNAVFTPVPVTGTPPGTVPPSGTPMCECVPPTGTPKPPGSSPPPIVNPPPIEMTIGEQLSCLGGGLVPMQDDFAFAEVWWGR